VRLRSEGCLGAATARKTNPEGRLKAGIACCSAFAVAGDLGLRLDANGLGANDATPSRIGSVVGMDHGWSDGRWHSRILRRGLPC
jgi:hypothetical protein